MSEDQALAELRWLINDPSLLRVAPGVEDGGGPLRAASAESGVLERAAEQLHHTATPHRLGQHFENLVTAVLTHSRRFQVIARNLPLRGEGATLGELDLLVRDHADGTLCHWELALKFYLGLPQAPPATAWPGPDPRDQLARKVRHLRDQQLPRSSEPAVVALLSRRGWRVQRRVLLTRGRLFYRADGTPAAPDDADPAHRRGLWWRCGEVPEGVCPVSHRYWHVPLLSDTRTAGIAAGDWRDYVGRQWAGRHRAPVMLVAPDRRVGFLVPDDWPAPF